MAKGNALQAMLDRAKVAPDPEVPALPAAAPAKEAAGEKPPAAARRGTKLIGGHFAPEVSTQLRIIAAEEGATVQALLAEALDDLFVKKGTSRIAGKGV